MCDKIHYVVVVELEISFILKTHVCILESVRISIRCVLNEVMS